MSHDHPPPRQRFPWHGHARSPPRSSDRCARGDREIFRPHSHDAADSLDTALEASERGLRAVKISFAALMVTALVQVVIIWATGSVALLADTIHNFSDALTAIPLFIAFRLSRRPPTRRYTYGYRRAEDLAGVFVIAMIALSAVIAAYEAIDRLIHPRPITNIGWLFVGRAHRVRRQRAGRPLPDPGRSPDRVGGVGGRRLPRPHRRVHLAGRVARRGRRLVGVRAGRPDRRAGHLRRHLRRAARRRPPDLPPADGCRRSRRSSSPSSTPPVMSTGCSGSVRCRPAGSATGWRPRSPLWSMRICRSARAMMWPRPCATTCCTRCGTSTISTSTSTRAGTTAPTRMLAVDHHH